MHIIKLCPESNGAHGNQTWHKNDVPDGYAEISEQFLSTWEQYKPFVTITVEDGEITSMIDNPEARAAQDAADVVQAPQTAPEIAMMSMVIDHEFRIIMMEMGV